MIPPQTAFVRPFGQSLRHGLRRATVPQFNMVASLRAQSALAMFPVSLGLLRPVSATGGGLRTPLFPSGKRRLLDRATSYGSATIQKAPLGIKGAHEARALCAEQREVSPMKQGVPQASLRAQWYDHAELRNAVGASRLRGFPIPPSRLTPCHLPFPFGKKEAFGWCCFMR